MYNALETYNALEMDWPVKTEHHRDGLARKNR